MYSMVTAVPNTVLSESFLRVNLESSHHTHTKFVTICDDGP